MIKFLWIKLEKFFSDNRDIYFIDAVPLDFFLKKSKKNYYFNIIKAKKIGKRRLKNNFKFHNKNKFKNIFLNLKYNFLLFIS